MIELKTLNPNLMVDDVLQTLDFYLEILGFQLVQVQAVDGQYIWAIIKSGEIILMFHQAEHFRKEYPMLQKQPIGASMTLYMQGQGIESLYENINEKVTVVKPLVKKDYGTIEFAIQDNNGYILAFSEAVD